MVVDSKIAQSLISPKDGHSLLSCRQGLSAGHCCSLPQFPTWILDDFRGTSWARLLELLQLHLDLPWWEVPCEFVPEKSGNGLGYDGYFVCRTSHCDPFWEPPQMQFVKILKFPECPGPNCPLWRPAWFWRAAHPKEQTGWRHLKTNTSGRTLPLVSLFTMPAKSWDSSESAIQECQPLGCLATHFLLSLTPVVCWLKQLSVNRCTLSDFLLRL